MDLYYDRNMKDKIIGPSLLSIEKYFNNNNLNVNKKWGHIKKTGNINFHWGIKCKFKENTFFRDIIINNYKYNIIIEQGFLNRKYYRSFGINGYAGLSKIIPTNCPKDRFEKLNIKLKDINIKNNGYILLTNYSYYGKNALEFRRIGRFGVERRNTERLDAVRR